MPDPPVPELLAPAGCWASLKAAAANGADAVYFGVEALNARLRAENFGVADLPAVMAWLHQRDLKGFLTLNVLIFSDELAEVAGLLQAASRAGVDAVIVQDIGLMRLARYLTPDLAVHASTQCSITSSAGVALAAELGCRRVVLARELTLVDLERLKAQLGQRGLAMPLEVFVHGALCVSYSGQCLTSEALGQRSANRGECAQACRLPYQLIVDGQECDLAEQRYLLSPQDLAAWELLPQLAALGVASLKIEGRLKSPSYVAAVTEAYRQGLDHLKCPGLGSAPRMKTDPPPEADQRLRRQLELSFSRGLSSGWLEGIDHRRLVHGRWSKKRGPWLGRLEAVERFGGWLLLRGGNELKVGDGVVFEGVQRDPLRPPPEVGGRVMALQRRDRGCTALRLGPGRINPGSLVPGSPCWLTSDPLAEARFLALARRERPPVTRPLHVRVSGAAGQPLMLELTQQQRLPGGPWRVKSRSPLEPAHGAGLDPSRLAAQLGRLGGTAWHLEDLEVDLPPGLFLPVAELNRMRRELVKQLDACLAAGAVAMPIPDPRQAPSSGQLADVLAALSPAPASRGLGKDAPGSVRGELSLTVLVRNLAQLQALLEEPLHRVVVEIEHPAQLRQAVALGRGRWPGGVWLAGPRICRPHEAWTLEPLRRAEPDGYLVRNADQLEALTPLAPCIGDFSLNVANPLSAAWWLERWRLERVTASYDLALSQLLDLLAGCPAGRVEVTVHQHMPLFHMEHCLFCAHLSDGHDHTDCGRPCERHTVVLRDRSGAEHPLRADLGCRNTLFNGRAQTAAEAIPALRRAGVQHLRVELLEEGPIDALRRVQLYREALAGRVSGREVWQREQLDSRLGVTRGSLREAAASCVNISPSAP